MASRNDILTFARRGKPFTLANLTDHLQAIHVNFIKRSLETQLGRMVKGNELERLGRGLYKIAENYKREFNPHFNKEMEAIAGVIRRSYPFLDICVWSLEDIKRLSHYASKRDVMYVEVDRDAVEGVFSLLTDSLPGHRIFINPTEDEYTYYINATPAIVVKPLRTEAPCRKDSLGILHPSIEKIMVDVIADSDFRPWQDYEAERLFETIFSLYNVSLPKLMRYARRRSKLALVSKILSSINS